MVSQGFVGCTLGCLAGSQIEPNAAMLCLFSCYLVEREGGGNESDPGNGEADGNDASDGRDGETSDGGGDPNDEDDIGTDVEP